VARDHSGASDTRIRYPSREVPQTPEHLLSSLIISLERPSLDPLLRKSAEEAFRPFRWRGVCRSGTYGVEGQCDAVISPLPGSVDRPVFDEDATAGTAIGYREGLGLP